MTKVVNKKYDKYDVYCGRGSIFGNPYIIGVDGDRETVIKRYEQWFTFLLRDPFFAKEVLKLKDKVLGCFCKQPNIDIPCHCDIIANHLNTNS